MTEPRLSPPSDTSPDEDPSKGPPPSRTRRHLLVLGIALVGIVVGVTLVLTGQDDGSPDEAPSTSIPATVAQGPLLPSLGAVADEDAATDLINDLDPATLAGPEPSGTTDSTATPPPSTVAGVDLSEAGLQRCRQAITQQNTDRSLGEQLASARLLVGTKPAFVVSYGLPASGESPEGVRVILADARTCRVLGAVEY